MEKITCGCERCQNKLCARSVPVFAYLDENELGKVVSLIIRRHYTKGELIHMEGDLSQSLIIINQGMIKTFRYTPDGKEQILYIFSEGDFFGEMNLFLKGEALYNAQALADTHICMINKEDLQKLLRVHPDIGFKIMEELCARLNRMEEMIQRMSSNDADLRVNMVLLEFSKKYGYNSEKGRTIELPLSREGIANYIGVTRETVSRKLNHLKDEGIIELIGNKKIILIDEKALEEI
jgi:CRP/FNR family transcriptional regulator